VAWLTGQGTSNLVTEAIDYQPARDAVQELDKHKDQLKQQVQDKLQNLFK
jgi:hypothetical protein